MRVNTKLIIISSIIAANMMTISACKKQEEVKEDINTEQTQEFIETEINSWINSNYKKNWYSFDEIVYNETLEKLSKTGEQKYGYNIYKDELGDSLIIMGMDVLPLTTAEIQTNLQEKSGLKVYTVETEVDKLKLLARDYKDGTYINGNKLAEGEFIVETLEGELMINLSKVYEAMNMEYTASGTEFKGHTHVMPSKDRIVAEVMSTDKLQEVIDKDNNMYYAPFLKSETQEVFVTLPFMKNVMGWEIGVTDDNVHANVLIDNIYLPTEETINVKVKDTPAVTTGGGEAPPTQQTTAQQTTPPPVTPPANKYSNYTDEQLIKEFMEEDGHLKDSMKEVAKTLTKNQISVIFRWGDKIVYKNGIISEDNPIKTVDISELRGEQ